MKSLAPRTSNSAPIVSEVEFKAVTWVCLGFCIAALIIRGGIRIVCMGRLLVEDYLMLFALSLFAAVSAVLLVYMEDIYTVYGVEKELASVRADFLDDLTRVLRADGLTIILSTVGVWIVKLNFLVFFRRLTHQVHIYMVIWVAALVFVVACGAASLGLMPFQCTFSEVTYILEHCTTGSAIEYEAAATKAGVALDIVSDFILICFPISILWRSQINLRQKISLSAIFSLEVFTIAATIVRGSVFGAQFYKSAAHIDDRALDFIWIMFWQYIEFAVSFIVACTASFRSFWATREQQSRNDRYKIANNRTASAVRERLGNRTSCKPKGWEHLYGSVLESRHGLEGHTTPEEGDMGDYLELMGNTLIPHPSQSESTRALNVQSDDAREPPQQPVCCGRGDQVDDQGIAEPKPTYHQ